MNTEIPTWQRRLGQYILCFSLIGVLVFDIIQKLNTNVFEEPAINMTFPILLLSDLILQELLTDRTICFRTKKAKR